MSFLQTLKRQKLVSTLLIVFTLFIGIAIGTVVNTGVKAEKQTSSAAPDATPLTVPPAVAISTDFTKLAKRLEPSVVYIESDYLPKAGKKTGHSAEDEDSDESPAPGSNSDPSQMFRHFFGKPDPRTFRAEGSGTGFIVDHK